MLFVQWSCCGPAYACTRPRAPELQSAPYRMRLLVHIINSEYEAPGQYICVGRDSPPVDHL